MELEKLQELPELAKAVIAVMKAVKGIEKNSEVGTGQSAYKGVKDEDVKKSIGEAMEKHGLCLLPIGIEPIMHRDRWEEPDPYKQNIMKMKTMVLTEVTTKYLLLHESGQSIVLTGYGHGADSQDKSAGKATTYALKYCLLYTFLVATGKIDDADNHHSNEHDVPPATQNSPANDSKQKSQQDANKRSTKKPPASMTADQLSKALLSDEVTIDKFLAAIKKGTLIATDDQKKQLETKLSELKTKNTPQQG